MGRLTKRDEYGNADIIGVESADLQMNLTFDEMNKVTESLNKLAHYEDLEEQGRLVELPCRLGVTAWHISGGEIEKDIVDGIEYTADGFVLYSDGIFLGTLGDVAFLTREEAKAKLAEEGGGSDETD